MKHIKLFKSLIIVGPVLALVSPVIILSNTGCGNPEPEREYLADGSNWIGRTGGTLHYDTDETNHTYTIYSESNFTTDSTFTIPDAVVINNEKYQVTTIDDHAFRNCMGITGVNFGSVTTIEESAFDGCGGLTKVDLRGVTTIGESAFYQCPLRQVKIDPSNSEYKLVGTSTNGFIRKTSDASATLSPACGTLSGIACGNITIPEGVTTISDNAFDGCTGLTGVDLNSVTTIGMNVFNECSGLTGANFGSVTTVGAGAFDYCTGLTGINLGSVVTIGTMAFNGCLALTEADLSSVTTLGLDWNTGCLNLSSVIIGSQTYNSSADDGWGQVGPSQGCILYAPTQPAADAFKTNVITAAYAGKWAVQLF